MTTNRNWSYTRKHVLKKQAAIVCLIFLFALTGLMLLRFSKAAVSSAAIEPEDGVRTGNLLLMQDANASGGKAVAFVSPTPQAYTPVGAQSIVSKNDVVLENVSISSSNGACVTIRSAARITIKNSKIGPCSTFGVDARDSSAITLDNVEISSVKNGFDGQGLTTATISKSTFSNIENKSVYILSSTTIQITGNTFTNGGRNFVQFDKVNGANMKINNNTGTNKLGDSPAEDLINLYQSNGTAASPIEVIGNKLRNGGPSGSGSGIMTGDGGGSYQLIQSNILVDPGQVGIGVAGGNHITLTGNKIYSASHSWSNIGMYVWDQYASNCANHTVSNNQINWKNSSGASNAYWNANNCGGVSGESTNNYNAPIDASIWGP